MRVSGIFSAAALSVVSATVLLATSALAADYPTLRGTQYDNTPPPPQMGTSNSDSVDWSGVTIGGHGGLSRSYFDFDTSLQSLAAGPMRQTGLLSEANPPGWIKTLSGQDRGTSFGAILGYNMMVDDVLLGLEADYTRLGQSHTSADFIARRVGTSNGDVNDVTLTSTQTMRLHDYVTARVRLGWATGRFMPFATFGGAVGRFDSLQSVSENWSFQRGGVGPFNTALGFPITVTDNKRDVYGYGVTAGLGVDIALTSFAFLRAEYQYVRFASVKGSVVDVNTIRAVGGVKF